MCVRTILTMGYDSCMYIVNTPRICVKISSLQNSKTCVLKKKKGPSICESLSLREPKSPNRRLHRTPTAAAENDGRRLARCVHAFLSTVMTGRAWQEASRRNFDCQNLLCRGKPCRIRTKSRNHAGRIVLGGMPLRSANLGGNAPSLETATVDHGESVVRRCSRSSEDHQNIEHR